MRRLRLAIGICSAALFVPLLIPLATGRVFTLDDLGAYHLPMRYLYANALRNGESVLWTPAVFGGYYLFGEGQVGMAHPWHLLLYRFLPLGSAFNIEIVSSYAVMFAGVVLLLKQLRCSSEARWFGAMVFTFSGYNLFHLIHVNLVAAVAHIPWILLLVDRLARETHPRMRARTFIALTLVVASQILVGHVQQVWFTILLVAGVCVYFLWAGVTVTRVVWAPAALALGAIVAGVQLFPLFDVVSWSQRSDWTRELSLTFSLLPSNIIQLWSPFFFTSGVRAVIGEQRDVHEFIVYNGAFCTVALVWALMRWRTSRRQHLTAVLFLLGAIALILAFGAYGGLYPSLLAVPGLRWFRAPARHLMLFHLSVSILAAIVFEDLIELVRRRELIEWRRLWPLTIPFAVSVGAMAAGAVLIAEGSAEPLSTLATTMPWVAVFAIVSLLFAAGARGARWAPFLLVAITAADQGYWGFQYVFGDPSRPLMTINELATIAQAPEITRTGDRVDTRVTMTPNALVPRGFRVWHGYVGLPPELRLTNNDTTAELAGVTWRTTRWGIEPVQSTIPRARLLTHARVSSKEAADLSRIDVADAALVEQPIDGLSGPPGAVRVLEDSPGRIVVETTASGRQLLTLTERFDAGWELADDVAAHGAEVIGSPATQPIRVYGDFLGAVVESGTHRITFRFRPRSFRYGLISSAVGLLLVLCVVPFAFGRGTAFGTAVRSPQSAVRQSTVLSRQSSVPSPQSPVPTALCRGHPLGCPVDGVPSRACPSPAAFRSPDRRRPD